MSHHPIDTAPPATARCAARDGACPHEPAVRIIDRAGAARLACLGHGPAMLAGTADGRVYPLPGHNGAAIETYRAARAARHTLWTLR